MKDRILQIMQNKGMNQQEFSKASGIAPASLSSIFTGRTSPTLKHAEALHQHFPELNMSWLLFGDGQMMTSQTDAADAGNAGDGTGSSFSPDSPLAGARENSGLFESTFNFPPSQDLPKTVPASQHVSQDMASGNQYIPQIPIELLKKLDTKPRRIAEIRIFFDDGTFEVFKGNS